MANREADPEDVPPQRETWSVGEPATDHPKGEPTSAEANPINGSSPSDEDADDVSIREDGVGANASPSSEQDQRLDEAFAAYLRSCDTGEISSREDFLKQFPDLAGQLSELMEAADMIGRVTMSGPPEQETASKPTSDANADTIDIALADQNDSQVDPAATLPMANRAKGDPGPTLPFDLGDYRLLEVLGRGGMGVVYLAKQKDLQRMVAVKMIRSGILAGEAEVRRFYTEAQAAARLRHPGIVAVYQFGRRAGHHFFSMEYVEGTDLQKRIHSQTMDPESAARYVRDVAHAIGHAHQKGVLHRDLKPANVLIDADDRVHVTDFGLAKNVDADSSVTGSGAAIGTPHYMAPEQAGGYSDAATPQSDLYSLGAILFTCLAGRPPIIADTVMQTLLKVVHDPAPPVRSLRPDVPADLETITAKCLEKSPAKRYANAQRLADDLQCYLDGHPIQARPRSRVVKAWHWLEGIPIVGAITGRRKFDTTDHHRRLQTAMLSLFVMMPMLVVGLAWWRYREMHSMPQSVTIAGGLDGGVYTEVCEALAERILRVNPIEIEVVPSGGSVDNRQRLLNREVDLAPMQASAVLGDELCVVAPLFYEAVHVLAKKGSSIKSIQDLPGHRVAVGPDLSGSRLAAELVFDSLGFTPNIVERVVTTWPDLERQPNSPAGSRSDDASSDAAIVCIGRGSQLVRRMLASGRWQLLPIPSVVDVALQHPTLRPMTITSKDYPQAGLEGRIVETVGTTAFLAARFDTPEPLVQEALDALYMQPSFMPDLGIIQRKQASEWQGLSFHPVARRYFREVQ